LIGAGFKVQRINQPNATVPAGQVIGTDPAGGTQAPRGSTVRLFVSTGPQNVLVPNVVQSPEAQAQSTLTAAGFKVQVVTVPSTPSNNGIVLAQNPQGDTQAPQGSTVTLTVGKSSASSSTTSTT
jgi:serine/threonine-protein kinase